VAAGITPLEFFPKLDSRSISATVVFPDGTAESFAREATQQLEDALHQVARQIKEETGDDVLEVVYQRVGEVGDTFGGPTGVTDGSHVGTVEVALVRPEHRAVTSEEIVRRWRNAMPPVPGTDTIRFGGDGMGPGGMPVEFKLLADAKDAGYLEMAADECKLYLKTFKGVSDIEDDMRPGKYEMILRLNEQGRSLQLDETSLARTIRASYYGEEVMRLQRGRHDVKLMVRYPEAHRRSPEQFNEIRVRDNQAVERPVTEVADISFARAPAEINRLNQKRSITVTADVNRQDGGDVRKVTLALQHEFLPALQEKYRKEHGANLYVSWEGQQKQTMESFASMFVGSFIALLAMFVLLTFQFRSYVQPALILGIIPFGLIGAVFGHTVMGLPLTFFSFFGLVALTGVVVNDSIVLIDFINARQRDGFDLYHAALEAGRQRFRAVLLTSLTTIAGLIPIMLETSFQAQVLIPMAVTLVFGLGTTTAIVLILGPVFYVAYKDILQIAMAVCRKLYLGGV
jgi:multidrug efflux pump subunit AcrB